MAELLQFRLFYAFLLYMLVVNYSYIRTHCMEKGYYYVDKTGRKVNTREIRQAVDFVMRNSKAGDSRAKRLKACYRALQAYPYFGMTNRAPKAKNLFSYARYMFSRHR